MNLIDVVIGNADRDPDRAALLTDETAISYRHLLEKSSQCARFLAREGVRAGDRVGIALPRAEESLVGVLAAWFLGATPLVLDFRMKSAEKSTLASGLNVVAFVQARPGPGATSYLEIVAGDLFETIAGEDAGLYERPVTDHPALIFRTSGTTGTPQGIIYSHASLLHMHWMISVTAMGFDRGLFMHATPLFYSAGLARTLSQLLDGGASFVLPMITAADEFAERLVSSGARIGWVVPPQLTALLELSGGGRQPMLGGIRLLAGGANVSSETCMRAYHELTPDLCLAYGSSLCGAMATLTGEDLPAKAGTVGRPFAFNRLQIVDHEDRPCARGEAGRIRVRTICTAEEVIGEARESSDRIVDGWVVTGDIGYLDDEGYLTLTGRASDLIIRNGVNVFPREVEKVLDAHDEVVESAVVGIPHETAGEEIAAFVVAQDGVQAEQLAVYLRTRLVADKQPSVIRIVEKLPRNPSGKVVKRDLAGLLRPGV